MAIADIPDSMLSTQIVEVVMSFTLVYQSDSVNDTSVNSSTNPTRSTTPKSLGPYDVPLRIAIASLCHTDGMVSAGVMGTNLPCIGSHEGAGTVIHIGSAVTELKNGDRVMPAYDGTDAAIAPIVSATKTTSNTVPILQGM